MSTAEQARKWKLENPERNREINRDWYYRNRDRILKQKRDFNAAHPGHIARKKRRNRYRVDIDQSLVPDVCDVCGEVGRIAFDHCHVTDEFRGWLCCNCNSALGFVKDNPDLLVALAEYLKRSRKA